MKKLLILFLFVIISCDFRLSTQELAETIEKDLIERLANDPDTADVEFVEFNLLHKGGNEYLGMLEVLEPNAVTGEKDEVKFDVEVLYDGETYRWEILDD